LDNEELHAPAAAASYHRSLLAWGSQQPSKEKVEEDSEVALEGKEASTISKKKQKGYP
jgi:hypothetical protein